METKRFIGNDLKRLYVRIRKEIGPDAIIVRTRSLLREGDEPLIEILATQDDDQLGLPPQLQRSMVESVLAHVSPSPTVGDLEDYVARDGLHDGASNIRPMTFPRLEDAEFDGEPLPEGPDGFDEAQLLDQLAAELERRVEDNPALRIPPALTSNPSALEEDAADPLPGPEFNLAFQPEPDLPAAPAFEPAFGPAGMRDLLRHAGLSDLAVETVLQLSPDETEAARAVAHALEQGRTHYPAETDTTVISVQGPARSGRTTALLRMALDCVEAGRPAALAWADQGSPGAGEQVASFAAQLGIPFHDGRDVASIGRFAKRAKRGTCVFADVAAGPWRMPLPVGVRHFRYLAAPADWEPETLLRELDGFDPRAFSGLIPTFADQARDPAGLIDYALTSGLGLAFFSAGGDPSTGITVADPFMLASGAFTTATGGTTDVRITRST